MKPADFLTRLAKTERLYDEYRCPAFYVVPVVGQDEFLKRTKMTEAALKEAIMKFKAEFPKSIWEEDFEGIQVFHVSTDQFSVEITKRKYTVAK